MFAWRLLKTSTVLLFRHFSDVLKISLYPGIVVGVIAPLLLYWIAISTYWQGFGIIYGNPSGIPNSLAIFLRITVLIFSSVMMSYAAVGWHRFVLLSERSQGMMPAPPVGTVSGYLGRTILIGVITTIFVFALNYGFQQIMVRVTEYFVPIIYGMTLTTNFLVSYLVLRFGLILPGIALEQNLSLSRSWRTTGRLGGQLLLTGLGIGLLKTLTLVINFIGVPVLVAVILYGIANFVVLMIGLSVLTTLYGLLIEDRELPA